VRISKSLYAIIATILIAAIPVAAPAQFTVGIGFTIGFPPPAMPYYAQPVAPYPGYIWTPGYWAWGPAGYYWVPGTWVAPPAVGMYWTPGYWGYTNGGYGWNAGYWGPTVGFYGGVNYGYGYPGTGFYGGQWNGGNYAYNTAYSNVNTTVVNNTYNKTVINKNVCNNCSYNGGQGGATAKPTQGQIDARKNGKAPTSAQKQQATVAGQDRNQLASVNKGKPTIGASQKPYSSTNKPKNFAPVTAKDKQKAETAYAQSKPTHNKPANNAMTTQNKPANQSKQQQQKQGGQQQKQGGQQQKQGGQQQMQGGQQQQSRPHHRHNGGQQAQQNGMQGNPNGNTAPNGGGGGGKHKRNRQQGGEPPPNSGQPPR
jgi:hypothetical protein